jgi:hypothetical protein
LWTFGALARIAATVAASNALPISRSFWGRGSLCAALMAEHYP